MERKNVYIVGMYDRSITGFATYKEELSACMLTQPDLSVNITNLRCPIPEFRADEKCGIIIYDCPATKQNPLEVSVALLNLHIKNNNNNVFLINFAPSAPIVKILREYFNQGKIVYVIHDFMWTTYLWADLGTCRILLYVGRASKQKGIIDLLECFKVVLKVFPDCKLALMGEIDSKVIGAMDDKIRPNVLLLGEQHMLRRPNNRRLILTINPTLVCNFNRPYCFETTHPNTYMSDKVEDDIIQYISSNKDIKAIDVTWFGGEPLLAFDRAKSLTPKIKKRTTQTINKRTKRAKELKTSLANNLQEI